MAFPRVPAVTSRAPRGRVRTWAPVHPVQAQPCRRAVIEDVAVSQGLWEPVQVRRGTFRNPASPPSRDTGHRREPMGVAWGLLNPVIKRKEVCVCVLVGDGGGSPAEVTDNSSDLFPETPISCRAVKSPGHTCPGPTRPQQTGSPPQPESPRKKWRGEGSPCRERGLSPCAPPAALTPPSAPRSPRTPRIPSEAVPGLPHASTQAPLPPAAESEPGRPCRPPHTAPPNRALVTLLGVQVTAGNSRAISEPTASHLPLQIKCRAQDFAKVIVHYNTNCRAHLWACDLHSRLDFPCHYPVMGQPRPQR